MENLFNASLVSISLDFANGRLISGPFADEVFGELFSTLGPIRFGQLWPVDLALALAVVTCHQIRRVSVS